VEPHINLLERAFIIISLIIFCILTLPIPIISTTWLALIFGNSYFDPLRKTTLSIYGPKGIKIFLKNLFVLYPVLNNPPYPIAVHELEQDTISVNEVTIATRPLNHQQSACLGYRINYQGKSIIYSGDTDYCDALVTLAQHGDVLIVECSFPDGYKVDGHLTPAEIGQIAAQAQVKKSAPHSSVSSMRPC